MWVRLLGLVKILGLGVVDNKVLIYPKESGAAPAAYQDPVDKRVWVSWQALRAVVELRALLLAKENVEQAPRLWAAAAVAEAQRADAHTEFLGLMVLYLGPSGRTFDNLRLVLSRTGAPAVWAALLSRTWDVRDDQYVSLLIDAEKAGRLGAVSAALKHVSSQVRTEYLQDLLGRQPEVAAKLLDAIRDDSKAAAVATVHGPALVKALFAARAADGDAVAGLLALAKAVPKVAQDLYNLCFDTLLSADGEENDAPGQQIWDWCVRGRGAPPVPLLLRAAAAKRWRLVPVDLDDAVLRQLAALVVNADETEATVQSALAVLNRQGRPRFKAVRAALADAVKDKGQDDCRNVHKTLVSLMTRA